MRERLEAGGVAPSVTDEILNAGSEVERIMQMATAFASAFSSNYGSDEDEATVRYYRNALREAISALLAAARRDAENEGVASSGFPAGCPADDAGRTLVGRLNQYLAHTALCGVRGGYGYCTCGLDALLAEYRDAGVSGEVSPPASPTPSELSNTIGAASPSDRGGTDG